MIREICRLRRVASGRRVGASEMLENARRAAGLRGGVKMKFKLLLEREVARE